jgi:hypothetical protein
MSKRTRRLTRRVHVHPFLFFGSRVRGRERRAHHARDLLCVPPLLSALAKQGFEEGEAILNMPPEKGQEPTHPLAPVPVELADGDALLIVTRLPLDDAESDRKRVLRGWTELEPYVLRCGRRVFALLNRTGMRLQKEIGPHLAPGYENHACIDYYQTNGAAIRRLRPGLRMRGERPPPDGRTSAFLLHDRLWQNGPNVIAAFSMNADAAVVWSQILARRHPEWLRQPGFLMVDLVPQELPERPTTLRFAFDWRVEPVLRVKF